MDTTTIDLNRAEKAMSTFIIKDPQQQQYQQGYQPRTLQAHNSTRENFLPIYPIIGYSSKDPLLLANVPGLSKLSSIFLLKKLYMFSCSFGTS